MAAPAESAVPAKKVQTSAVLPEEAVGTVAKVEEAVSAAAEDIAAVRQKLPLPRQRLSRQRRAAEEAKPAVKPVKVKKVTQKATKAEALQ